MAAATAETTEVRTVDFGSLPEGAKFRFENRLYQKGGKVDRASAEADCLDDRTLHQHFHDNVRVQPAR